MPSPLVTMCLFYEIGQKCQFSKRVTKNNFCQTRFVFTQKRMSHPSRPWPSTGMVGTWVLHIAFMRWTYDTKFMKIPQAVSEIWSGHDIMDRRTDGQTNIQHKNNISPVYRWRHNYFDIGQMVYFKLIFFFFQLFFYLQRLVQWLCQSLSYL